ncbi:hypothetical protein Gasu2_45260 [Galdieria sulphuraria]|uniref:2Fe-2S iron-sulfur cluster binding domain protein n=1 Tax=Galdieria sulphuraria TaxID=130081 RepID=M2Y722_GALSU|nr:2Fe-2S iron-sulfur cluster binding domain protein [Galdieria sulphuraria]EME31828.1 2Fe-2S iron-sulfur cluster binding domain protein [Galdieria sulphuraria]GJD10329.1 hypothetical protein Gasu2_45260 [Galdieria sulphuraria]|eukprot:XP_005708348.1 2Fe-2S iron-sulfur cluster binding domain protein [Galdieria sulphuraria]
MTSSHLLYRCSFLVIGTTRKTNRAMVSRKPQLCQLRSVANFSIGNQVKITFLPEGVSVLAQPGEPLYNVAERAGVELLFSCCVGDCGSCEVQVLSRQQTKKHRKLFIRPCIAKVPANKSELVLHTVGSDVPPW